jgi:hypothetical protein
MKYSSSNQGWTVNALAPDYTWYIGTGLNNKLSSTSIPPGSTGYQTNAQGCSGTPGNGCAFPTYAECVAYSKQLPPVNVTIATPSSLGVFLVDGANGANDYGDNVPGTSEAGGRNPAWSIKAFNCGP